MSDEITKTYSDFVLPSSVVTKIDISRLVAEAERVDNDLTTSAVRVKAGSQAQTQPTMSDSFAEFLNSNNLQFDDSQVRTAIIKELRLLKDKAPVLHMTFAVPADIESLQKLAEWVRATINPQAVIAVGLQPALVAGAYVRTTNHVHDFSIRGALEGRHALLVEELESLRVSK